MTWTPPVDAANSGPKSPSEISVERTYLALDGLQALRPARPPRAEARLSQIPECPVPTWRALYRQIGTQWHWHDRDAWSDDELATRLARPEIAIFEVATRPRTDDSRHGETDGDGGWERPMGFLELERRADGSVEIVYLGLDVAVLGQGLGGWLVTEAARTAAGFGDGRVILNTCTLDAPAALPNYLARGFRITRTEHYTATLRRPDP